MVKNAVLRRVAAHVQDAGGPDFPRVPKVSELRDFLLSGFIAPEELERLAGFLPSGRPSLFPGGVVRREAAAALAADPPGTGVWALETTFLPCLLLLWRRAPRPESLLLAEAGDPASAFALAPSPWCEAAPMSAAFSGAMVPDRGRCFAFPGGAPEEGRESLERRFAGRRRSPDSPGVPFSVPQEARSRKEYLNVALGLLPALYPPSGGLGRLRVAPLDLAGLANPLRRRLQRRDLEPVRRAVQFLSGFWLFSGGSWHQLFMVDSWPADGAGMAVFSPNPALQALGFGRRGAMADLPACLLLNSLQQRLYLNACHLLDLGGVDRSWDGVVRMPWRRAALWLTGGGLQGDYRRVFRTRARRGYESLHGRGLLVLLDAGREVAFRAPEVLREAALRARRGRGLSPGRFPAVVAAARRVAAAWSLSGHALPGRPGELPLLAARA